MSVSEDVTYSMRRLRVLLALTNTEEVECLRAHVEDRGHSVSVLECSSSLPDIAADIDVLICDDRWNRPHHQDGLWLAEQCRGLNEHRLGRLRTQAILLISSRDWFQFLNARRTGAHVVVRPKIDLVLRYIDVVAEELINDRILGPMLVGLHTPRGSSGTHDDCSFCEWIGCSLLYGTSEVNVLLPATGTAVLNALMFRRRGQSPEQISSEIRSHSFLRRLVLGRTVSARSIKMEISRIRKAIDNGLRLLGAPYRSIDLLPNLEYAHRQYHLSGNWQIVHLSRGPGITVPI